MNQLKILYDDLYERGQQVLDKYNPCKFETGADGKVSCYESRKLGRKDAFCCCYGCKHWNNGCTVHSLACKLWLCNIVSQTRTGKKADKELRDLKVEAWAKDVPMLIRGSKQENFACHT